MSLAALTLITGFLLLLLLCIRHEAKLHNCAEVFLVVSIVYGLFLSGILAWPKFDIALYFAGAISIYLLLFTFVVAYSCFKQALLLKFINIKRYRYYLTLGSLIIFALFINYQLIISAFFSDTGRC